MMKTDGQVLMVLHDVLLEDMDSEDALPCYRVQDVLLIDNSTGTAVDETDEPGGLLLVMRDGRRFRLTLTLEDQ